MAYNKVLFPDKTVAIDLTQDTVTEETLAIGVIAHNKAGEKIVGTAEFGMDESSLQDNKTVTPTSETQTVAPDDNYVGLKQVTVEAVPTEILTATQNATYYPSDGKFFRMVNVEVEGGADLINLPITATKEEQVFVPSSYGADGFNQVTVSGYKPVLEDRTITANGTYTVTDTNAYDGLGVVTVNISGTNTPTLVNLEANPALETQTILPSTYNADGFSQVTINGVQGYLRDVTITPKTYDETYNAVDELGYLGFNNVTIKGVTSSIDSDIKPENIKVGVNILGVTGTYSPTIEDMDLSATTLIQKYALEGFNYYDSNSTLVTGTMQLYKGAYEEIE